MSRTITLAQIRNKIRFQADLIGATVRHPDTGGNGADITTLVNDSIQGFREAISNDGNQHYLAASSGTLTAGATSPYSFGSLDLSAISPSIVRTYGLDITVDGVVHSLDHRPFTERNIWGGPATTGIPRHWAHYQTAKLAIQPAPEAAYSYTLWYLPVLADLSADGDTFDGVAGWEEWIVWDVVCRLLIRDQQSQAFITAKTYRDDVWTRIKTNATRVSSAGGAVVGRDSLRGRIPDFLAARQAVMAGGGPPPSGSVTLDMLADMTGPAFIARESGTGRPQVVGGSAAAQSILPLFGPTWRGLVPAAGGSSTSLFLSQAGTFEAVASSGGGSPGGPTGSIQFKGLSGFVGYTGFGVMGSPPSMTVALPGSLRVTGGQVEVGSGTVIMSASGIDVGGGALWNVASLTASEIGAQSFKINPGGSGIDPQYLQPIGSGTVLGRLSGTGTPQITPVATLFAAIPTFTSSSAGVVPPSGGGTDNFLRADGAFAIPPGVGSSPSGITNAQLAPMNSGTVKMRRSATGIPEDVATPTLFSFFPTFSSNLPGLVPPSGGGTSNFLRADGAFATPPGGSATPSGASLSIQFNNAGAFGGTTGIAVGGSGTSLRFGVSPAATGLIALPQVAGAGIYVRAVGGTNDIPVLRSPNPGTDDTVILGGSGMFRIDHRAGAAALAGGHRFETNNGDSLLELQYGTVPNAAFAGNVSVVGGLTLGSGLANAYLAPMGSGTVKANLSGTGAPSDVPIATLLAFAPTFTSARAGVVPPSDGAATSYLAGNGTWSAPSGAHQFPPAAGVANAQLATVASGTVKGSLTNTNPSDILIPTLAAFFPTMTSTRAGIVGPGGGTLTNFLRGDGAFAAPTGFFSNPTGLPNANLSVMPSGTVKANLSGTAAPSDVVIPTLMAFFPTFIAGRVGLVPGTADGDTGKFLNAAGAFSTPVAAATPGGDSGNVQWNNGGAMGGASAIHAVVGGAALAIGPQALVADRYDIRVASGFAMGGRNASGIAQPIVEFWNPTGTVKFGGSGLARMTNEVASGGVQEFIFGGATATTARITPSGADFTAFHAAFKSLSVPNINGYPADANQLSRGAMTWMASGLRLYVPKGASTGANRFVIPTGALGTNITITLWPTGARGGNTIRVERLDRSAGTVTFQTPTGTTLYVMPSGTAEVADFVFTKPSGAAFEHGGNAGLF